MKQIIETLDWLIRNDMITRGRTQIPITANLIGCKDIVIAFEIIAKKRVNILLFLDSLIYDGLNYYNSKIDFINLNLTQDEFDLLRKVLNYVQENKMEINKI